ncbi:hypothetical protein LSAT2_008461 [Lamellibrachia satsuma]|nr:hypothetical protein LSAT2_008461 [Lamellibrachia satsuma]
MRRLSKKKDGETAKPVGSSRPLVKSARLLMNPRGCCSSPRGRWSRLRDQSRLLDRSSSARSTVFCYIDRVWLPLKIALYDVQQGWIKYMGYSLLSQTQTSMSHGFMRQAACLLVTAFVLERCSFQSSPPCPTTNGGRTSDPVNRKRNAYSEHDMRTNNMTFSKVDGRWMHWHHVLFMILCGIVVVMVYIVSTHEFRAYGPGERSVEDSLYHVKVNRSKTCYKLFKFAETPLNVTALASFPRSGNTWTRRMLTEVTDSGPES